MYLPVGNAGNITAYWKGYKEYRAANQTTRLPRMMGFQAAGAAPIVLGSRGGRSANRCDGDPDRQSGQLAGGAGRGERVLRGDRLW